jgi:acyl-homoserine lactone acylase PvdQ
LEAPYRNLLTAYADGVNAYQAQAAGRLPLEYLIAGFEPVPWAPEDSLLVGAYMAHTQSFNLKEELTFLRLAARVGAERARELFPTDEGVAAPPLPAGLPEQLLEAGDQTVAALGALLDIPARYGLPVPGPASNAWVITGERTAGGGALLANDTHLPPSMPGTWYELELIGPDLHVAGLALPGVPLVLIGHNADLAWGFTSAMADTQDLFLEHATGDGLQVQRPDGRPKPIQARVQHIAVEARTDALGFRSVAQNLMLAHRDGGIAWQVTGLLPRRGRGTGLYPVPGWVEGYGWEGVSPQGRNPGAINPPGSALITANQRTVPLDASAAVSHSWMPHYRAQRIAERLAQPSPLGPSDLADIQTDRQSIQARLTQHALRRIEPQLRALDPGAWEIGARGLLAWDAVMDGASRPAAFYALLEPALFRAIYGDELGEDLDLLMAMAIVSYNPLQETLRRGDSSFWDDVTTPEPEGPAHGWARALRAAESDLVAPLPKPEDQRLDRLRTLTLTHAFHRLPLLGPLFDLRPIGVGGGPIPSI